MSLCVTLIFMWTQKLIFVCLHHGSYVLLAFLNVQANVHIMFPSLPSFCRRCSRRNASLKSLFSRTTMWSTRPLCTGSRSRAGPGSSASPRRDKSWRATESRRPSPRHTLCPGPLKVCFWNSSNNVFVSFWIYFSLQFIGCMILVQHNEAFVIGAVV